MLDRAYNLKGVCHSLLITPNPTNDIFQPINLFISSADQLYGPITTLRRDGRLTKNIPWVAFALNELDWARVLDAKMILAMSFTNYSFNLSYWILY